MIGILNLQVIMSRDLKTLQDIHKDCHTKALYLIFLNSLKMANKMMRFSWGLRFSPTF